LPGEPKKEWQRSETKIEANFQTKERTECYACWNRGHWFRHNSPDKVIHFPMPKGLPNRKGEAARRIELYSSAYKLAWEQISPAERRAHPDISLRIDASIRRQLKQGEVDPRSIAFAAIKDALIPDTL
jgi:hypothetical protein